MIKFFCHRRTLVRGSEEALTMDLPIRRIQGKSGVAVRSEEFVMPYRGTGSRNDQLALSMGQPLRRPNAPQGGHAQPYARRHDDDRNFATQRLAANEDNEAAVQTQIAATVDRLIATLGARETLRLLTLLGQEAPPLSSEPFATARPLYNSSFAGTGAADRRPQDAQPPLSPLLERFPELRKITIL
jgi:hypothetical protein